MVGEDVPQSSVVGGARGPIRVRPGALGRATARPGVPLPTQGPSWGYFKSQLLTGLSSFGDCSPQNGSKTVPKSQNRPLGYPHEGPFVVRARAGGVMAESVAYPVFLFLIHGYLVVKKTPPLPRLPQGPRHGPTAGSQEGAFSCKRGTPVALPSALSLRFISEQVFEKSFCKSQLP